MVKTKTEQAIIDALEAVAPQHDVDIVDVELVGATKAPCVRVRIEGAEGQSLSLNDVTANTKWVGDTNSKFSIDVPFRHAFTSC